MSKVRLYGDTSGYVDLKAPDIANDVTITLPNTTGPFATETYVDSAIAAIPGIGSNVVQTVKTDTFSTSSSSFVTVTGMTATITPTSASSNVLIIVQAAISVSAGSSCYWRIAGGNSGNYIGDSAGSRSRVVGSIVATDDVNFMIGGYSVVYLDSPATTSATTYELQFATTGSRTIYLNRNNGDSDIVQSPRGASSITAIEVAA